MNGKGDKRRPRNISIKEWEDNYDRIFNKGNEMNLMNCVTYLSGPMERCSDDGKGWRKDLTPKLKEMGIIVLDPTSKYAGLKDEAGKEADELNHLKEIGDFDNYTKIVKRIVRADLRMCDLSDFLIVKIYPDIPMCGTIHEVVVADIQKKPIFVIVEGGKKRCPGWLFGIINHKHIFNSENELLVFLEKVNGGIEKIGLFTEIRRAIENSRGN